MGGNVFKSNSTHEPTTWQNWPEAKKPCTVQLNGHLSHTVRLKPDRVPYCMLKQMRSTVKHNDFAQYFPVPPYGWLKGVPMSCDYTSWT